MFLWNKNKTMKLINHVVISNQGITFLNWTHEQSIRSV